MPTSVRKVMATWPGIAPETWPIEAGGRLRTPEALDAAVGNDNSEGADVGPPMPRMDPAGWLDRLPDPVWVVKEGRLVAANAAWTRCVGAGGVTASLGARVADRVDREDRRSVAERLARWESDAALGRERTGEVPREVRWPRTDGEPAVLELSCMGPTVHQGAPAVVLVARDVTELRMLRTRTATADRLVSVGTMAAGVAHEINNPLAYVISNVHLATTELPSVIRALERGEAGAAVARRLLALKEALDDARHGAERVRNIVRDLKTFARATDDEKAALHLPQVIDATLNLAWNEIRHHARLVKDYGPVPAVDANESRLGQVVLNLLINAAQATPLGAADRHTIRITTATDAQGRAVLEVRDTGVGIAPEQLGRIFDPFFTTKAPGTGTGLGLAICQGIVTAMEGSIEVESRVGEGSTFRVVLPPARLDAPLATPVPPPVGTRRGRVLVVDDEPMVVASLRRILALDHEVFTATTGREALSQLATMGDVDVILCDLMMPEMSGIDLYDALAQRAPGLVSRLVFLTGGAFTPGARAFLDRVPNPRFEKPFDVQNLRALVSDRLR